MRTVRTDRPNRRTLALAMNLARHRADGMTGSARRSTNSWRPPKRASLTAQRFWPNTTTWRTSWQAVWTRSIS